MKDKFKVIAVFLLKILSAVYLINASVLLILSAVYKVQNGITFFYSLIIVILFLIFAVYIERWLKDKIIQNNFIYKISVLLILLSLIIFGLKIYSLIYNLKYLIEYYPLYETFIAILKGICDILYTPLWCIWLSLLILLCYYKIKNKTKK
jgi:hypothetical protein